MSTENYNASFVQKTSHTIGVSAFRQSAESNVLPLIDNKGKMKHLESWYFVVLWFLKITVWSNSEKKHVIWEQIFISCDYFLNRVKWDKTHKDNFLHLMIIYYTMCHSRNFTCIFYLILIITLWVRCYYYSHLRDVETEAQNIWVTSLRY